MTSQNDKPKKYTTLTSVAITILLFGLFIINENAGTNNRIATTKDKAEISYSITPSPSIIREAGTDDVCIYKDNNPASLDVAAVIVSFLGKKDTSNNTCWALDVTFYERIRKMDAIRNGDMLSLRFTDSTGLSLPAEKRFVQRGIVRRGRRSVSLITSFQAEPYSLSSQEMQIIRQKTIESITIQAGTQTYHYPIDEQTAEQLRQRCQFIMDYIHSYKRQKPVPRSKKLQVKESVQFNEIYKHTYNNN